VHQRRDRRALIAAIGLSSFGDELAIIALLLRISTLTDSVWAVTALLIVSALPHVLFAPVAGWLTDRTETVRTLRWFSLAQAAVAFALAFAGSVPLMLVLAFVLGSLASVTGPSVFTLVPLLGEDNVARTNSSIEIAKYAGWIAGPFVAGVVAERSGSTTLPLLIDSLTFLVLAIGTLSLSIRRVPATAAEEDERHAARAGFAYVLHDRLLLLVFIVMAGIVLFAATDNVAEFFFARDTLGNLDLGYGLLATGWMVGMVGGAILARRVTAERGPMCIFTAAIGGGLAVAAAAWSAALAPAVALFVLAGVANGAENVAARTLLHGRTPQALHGRVFAAYMGLMSGTQIAATALGGALVGAVGGQQALVIGGVGSLAVGVVGLIGLAFAREPATADPAPLREA
jgi:MFS family permease